MPIQKILLVDDSKTELHHLSDVLGRRGYQVRTAENADDAMRRLTNLPLGVGFGIKDAETAARVAETANAVIVGSAVVGRIEALRSRPAEIPAAIGEFLRGLRESMDRVRKI